MANIAIDIDETLYSFDDAVREAFFEMSIEADDKSIRKGAYSLNQEWRNLTDVLGAELALEAIDRVHSKTINQIPFKNAPEVCVKLGQAGHTIKYVTSRKDEYQTNTEKWLKFWEFPKGEVICSTHDKTEHIRDCQYLIDDRPKTIIEFITDFTWRLSYGSQNKERERKAFGLWRPYNHNLTDVKNVLLAPTWSGIEFYLKRKGVLD